MVKSVGKRFLSIALVIVMVLTLLPVIEMSASAASVNTGVEGLSADSSGSATWTSSGGTITGSVEAEVSSCMGFDSFTKKSGKLTFKNSSEAESMLSFDYSPTLNGGSVKINEESVTVPGTFNLKLAANATVDIEIESNEVDPKSTTITISNLKLTKEQSITLTCKAPTNGSYTVNSTAVTADTKIEANTTDIFAFSATAASGFKLIGWFDVETDVCLSTAATISLTFQADTTIEPRFIASAVPLFKVGGNIYTDLNEATNYAISSSNATIILISSGVLPADNYTIPSGKTLLIPMDATYTMVRETPSVIYNSYIKPTAYCTLTMASGANITVASGGAISLASVLSAKGQMDGWNGTPTGPDGRINMAEGSSITVRNGGNLYAWGYIHGAGAVFAESGATIHEAFQVKDWRGGTATSTVAGYAFIFNQYYVQNIEVPLTLYAGATEKLYSAVNASSAAHSMGATFIGNGGMFSIEDGYIVKDYIESTDRLQIDAYGKVLVTPMTLTGLPIIDTISTGNYSLPITSNITINIHDGVTANITQDIELLPSSELNVDAGATLNINSGKKVYVYDNDDWGNFTGSAKLYPIGYSVANGTTAKRTAADLTDAKIDVNGTLSVSGRLYTSAGGANITSSAGTGKVMLATAPGTSNATIYECANNSTKTAVTFNPAKLHNGVNTEQYVGTDEEYTPTLGSSANTTFAYCALHDMWEKDTGGKTVTFNANEGEGSMDPQTTCPAGGVTLAGNAFTREGYDFTGWNTAVDGSGTAYADGASITVAADTTLYAQWKLIPETHTVTWKDENGTVLETDENVEEGTMPEYNGEIPTKAEDANNYYVFSGWDKALESVTDDVTYTAVYAQKAQNYSIEVYYNVNGVQGEEAVLSRTYSHTQSVRLGAEPEYTDGDKVYTFSHWEVDGVAYPALKITARPESVDHTVIAQAVYVENADDAMYKGDALIQIIRADRETIGPDTAKMEHKWVFTLTQSVPTDKAEEVGFVVSQTVPNPGVDTEGVYKAVSNLKTATSTFTTRVNVTGQENLTLYVRAYVKHNGLYIYSDEQARDYTFSAN